ncbi:hypothetical protein LCGC14_2481110 [marine sediment metagenome]|uniref:Uncharacterized protein n=1 Tax=marine sediment metagenome TaxID=412755 RepID=A0A0F9E188_9ZZZZ
MNEKMNTVLAATNSALSRGHLLSSWKQIDKWGRVIETRWALCLKCGGSIFTYRDGSYLGLESKCSLEVRFQEGGADSSIEQHRRVSSKTVTFTVRDRQ